MVNSLVLANSKLLHHSCWSLHELSKQSSSMRNRLPLSINSPPIAVQNDNPFEFGSNPEIKLRSKTWMHCIYTPRVVVVYIQSICFGYSSLISSVIEFILVHSFLLLLPTSFFRRWNCFRYGIPLSKLVCEHFAVIFSLWDIREYFRFPNLRTSDVDLSILEFE